MIPPGDNEQAIKEGEEARASVEAVFQKARTFGERGTERARPVAR